MPREERSRPREGREDRYRRDDPERERRHRDRSRRHESGRDEVYDSERERERERRREERRRDPERAARHEERKRRRRQELADAAAREEEEARRQERIRDREWRISQQEARRALDDSRETSRDRRPRSYSRARSRSTDSRTELSYPKARRESRDPYRHQRPERARKKPPRATEYDDKYESLLHSDMDRGGRDHKPKRRLVSGALLEDGEGRRLTERHRKPDKYERSTFTEEIEEEQRRRKRKKIFIFVAIGIVLLAIIIPVSFVLSKKKGGAKDDIVPSDTSDVGTPSRGALDDVDPATIPTAAKNTDLDPFSWLDTADFNVTYTDQTVGGLPVMGLFSEWDDSARANPNVPPLNEPWGSYEDRPARGVNVGGWLQLEPFITPSFFRRYDIRLGVIDEWTFMEKLGPTLAKQEIEKHYATFINEQTFKEIRDAGLDHVRIPFGYWMVKNFADEPFVERVGWRYMLRAIEWARKYGLRVNLDPHGMPGSQNGWNHSGRQGDIGWLNGTEGALNGERSLEIHKMMATFFSQPRYKNIIAFYGLVNEPKMTALKVSDVNDWTGKAFKIVREAGITCPLIFGDGFLGLENWQGQLSGLKGLVLDVHQYLIFNVGQIVFGHKDKVTYACNGWTDQAQISMDVTTGFGPTIFAEWSQADTDCAENLNNVGMGSRWEGTYDTGNEKTRVISPVCPTTGGKGPPCSCAGANADPSEYSADYKLFLKMFAEAQMHSFEVAWGWFYWTWKTEASAQWSYKKGLEIGILPKKAYEREFNCTQPVPSFSDLPENY